MSRRKRRNDSMAPALFPFLAVLLCTIGALVLVLAITVTSSHAAAKKDAELALLVAKDQSNQAKALSSELAFQREEMKLEIERKRQELQDIEDHIDRLKSDLSDLEGSLSSLTKKAISTDTEASAKRQRIMEIQKQIENKQQEIATEIEKKKNRRPAFAIMPYSGKNGTARRPVYIECVGNKVIIQPEGIVIDAKELVPPGPGNPLATALRLLRKAYSEKDAQYGFTQPPYPLLVVRPNGIEAYARARAAMSSWDDQFGYELVEESMDLVFPPGIPGLDKSLNDAVTDAKQRQRALLAANPRLAREFELMNDDWGDSPASHSSMSRSFGGPSSSFVGTDETANGNFQMVKPIAGGNQGVANAKEGPFQGTTNTAIPGSSQIPTGAFSDSGTSQNGWGDSTAIGEASQNGGVDGEASTNSGSGGVVGGTASNGGTDNSLAQLADSNGNGQQSVSSNGSVSTSGSTGSPVPSQSSQDRVRNSEANPQINITTQSNNAKHVSADGDLKPIAVGAGKNWAQAKAEGKATPVSRMIQIIALKDKWMIVADSTSLRFDGVILHQEKGPQQASEELAASIRKRVDSWGPSVPGGFWVPTVEIHQASDAQLSTARLERLLEGSGVNLKVIPLRLPGN